MLRSPIGRSLLCILLLPALAGCARLGFGPEAESLPTDPPRIAALATETPAATAPPAQGLAPAIASETPDPASVAAWATLSALSEGADLDPATRATLAALSAPIRNATPDRRATQEAEVMGTLIALASATAVPLPDAQVSPDATEEGCQIPDRPQGIFLDPAPGSSPEDALSWQQAISRRVSVEIQGYDAGARRFDLRSLDPPLPYALQLRHEGQRLPLDPGQRYQLTHYDDTHTRAPAGQGLQIEDAAGLRLLIVNLRESDDAALRVLGGQRGGLSIRPEPTTCRFSILVDCGYERRALPLSFGLGETSISLRAGERGRLENAPAYDIEVFTNFARSFRSATSCPEPFAWPRSYRVERAD